MINCPNEIEPDVLHTVCATRVQKLKIELRMYGVIGGLYHSDILQVSFSSNIAPKKPKGFVLSLCLA